jgi:hypothetical protein
MLKSLTVTLSGAMLLASPAAASPFVIGGSAVQKSAAPAQIEEAYWRHGWHGGGWGWGPGALIGGLALGALAGSYYAYGPGYYGYGPGYYGSGPYYGYGPYGRCWRNAWGHLRCY